MFTFVFCSRGCSEQPRLLAYLEATHTQEMKRNATHKNNQDCTFNSRAPLKGIMVALGSRASIHSLIFANL